MNKSIILSNQKESHCPICESHRVKTSDEQERFYYGKEPNPIEITVIVPVHTCEDCSFQFTDPEADQIRHDAVCKRLGVMNPEQIKKIRQQYGLTRADFSAITDIGEASLHRWENGLLIQNAAYDHYLYLLSFEENVRRIQRKKGLISDPDRGSSDGKKPLKSIQRFKYLENPDRSRQEADGFELRKAS